MLVKSGSPMARRKKGVKSVQAIRLRHTKSKSHNPNEIERWKKITGSEPSCCVNRRGKIPKGPNKGKDIGDCKGRPVGAHVKFRNSRKLYIVPVCNRHNDTGWRGGPFEPGDWFNAKKTKAVSATNTSLPKTNTSLPKIRSQRQKKRLRGRRRGKFSSCQNPVLGSGRCRHHKGKWRNKRVRKGICGARIQK